MAFIFLSSSFFPKDEEQSTSSQRQRDLHLQFSYFLKRWGGMGFGGHCAQLLTVTVDVAL